LRTSHSGESARAAVIAASQLNGRVLLAVGMIVVGVRVVGWLMARLGQPPVLGEIVAGIVLGPSVLGLLAPEVEGYLFPQQVIAAMRILAEFGLILFVFLIGLEMDLSPLRGQGRRVVLISQTSILFPVMLAVPLALVLYPAWGAGVSRLGFTLFFATALSITAFPVLARLLRETGLFRTRIGVMCLLCAAVNDAMAWCLLAVVVAVVNASGPAEVIRTILCTGALVGAMLVALRPALARLADPPLWSVLAVLVFSAWATDKIGVNAVFGAFLAGSIMPRAAHWRHVVQERLEDVVSSLLLPIFFVLVGLSTRVDQLTSASSWLVVLLIMAVAITGKLGGSAAAARLTGESWTHAVTIGVLMNTRGLTEIVVLSVGLQLGLITPAVFTMLVIMALVTTVMAAPVLGLLGRRDRRRRSALEAALAGPGPHPVGLDAAPSG
jgi:Kef-type K+ transport system membrane component KefB